MSEADLLSACSDAEKAACLMRLVTEDSDFRARAARVARDVISAVDTDAIEAQVIADLLSLDQDDLALRAGRTRSGYVEPTEAAWQLLEEALEPWLADIERRAELGLTEPAERLACVVLAAIDTLAARTHGDEVLLGWAPDFLDDAADQVEGRRPRFVTGGAD